MNKFLPQHEDQFMGLMVCSAPTVVSALMYNMVWVAALGFLAWYALMVTANFLLD